MDQCQMVFSKQFFSSITMHFCKSVIDKYKSVVLMNEYAGERAFSNCFVFPLAFSQRRLRQLALRDVAYCRNAQFSPLRVVVFTAYFNRESQPIFSHTQA